MTDVATSPANAEAKSGNAASRNPPRPVRRRKDRTWLLRVEYVVARVALLIMRMLPLRLVYVLAESFLCLVVLLVPSLRRRSQASLKIAYPDQTPAWRRKMMWESNRYLAWAIVDMVLGPWLLQNDRYRGLVDIDEVHEQLTDAGVLEDCGALVISSHQGSAELASLACAQAGWPNAVIARWLDNRHINNYFLRVREPFPRDEIHKHGALLGTRQRLGDGGIVAAMIDQDSQGRGVFVPYFQHLAHTHHGAAWLAIKTGVPAFMLFCIRTRRRRFAYKVYCWRLDYERTLTGDVDYDACELTARMTREIENMARRYPEQAMWMHRRWKRKPPMEGPLVRRL